MSQDLSTRKARLLVQSNLLRNQLTVQVLEILEFPQSWKERLAMTNGVQMVKRHPIYSILALLALYAIKPRRIISFGIAAISAYKIWEKIGPFVSPVARFLLKRVKKRAENKKS